MKKLLCVVLIVAMLVLSLTGFTHAESTAVTEPESRENETGFPTSVWKVEKKESPYKNTYFSRVEWGNTLGLPDDIELGAVPFEVLGSFATRVEGYQAAYPNAPVIRFKDTILISDLDELNAYYFQEGGYPKEDPYGVFYQQLKNIDFSKKSLLFIYTTDHNVFEMISLANVVVTENTICAVYSVADIGGGCSGEWGNVVLLDKDTLPTLDTSDVEIAISYLFEFNDYPEGHPFDNKPQEWTLQNYQYPNVFAAQNRRLESTRCVFVPADKVDN